MGHAGLTLGGFDVFWFHMPAFFIVSGALTNTFPTLADRNRLWSKAKQYLIPYIAWSVLLYLFFLGEDNPLKYAVRVVCGGRLNITTFSYPFWFIFSLFWALWAVGELKRWVANKWHQALCILGLWAAVHIAYYLGFNKIILPWGLDCAPAAIVFVYLGDLFKQYVRRPWHYAILLVPASFFLLFRHFDYAYVINMADKHLAHPLLDLLVPCSCFFSLYLISDLLTRVPLLSSAMAWVGRSSLTIFFVHAAVLHGFAGVATSEALTAVAVVLGVTLHSLFLLTPATSFLFVTGKRVERG